MTLRDGFTDGAFQVAKNAATEKLATKESRTRSPAIRKLHQVPLRTSTVARVAGVAFTLSLANA